MLSFSIDTGYILTKVYNFCTMYQCSTAIRTVLMKLIHNKNNDVPPSQTWKMSPPVAQLPQDSVDDGSRAILACV